MKFPITLSAFLLVATAFAQEPPTVDARLQDGSIVRLQVIQKSFDIVTKYGTMVVPLSDINYIEFGHRVPEDIAKKIDSSIIGLASASYKERERSQNELFRLGKFSYNRLLRVVDSEKELEAHKRVSALLKQIKDGFPPDHINRKNFDVIDASDFNFKGKISGETIEVVSPIFGKNQLPLYSIITLTGRNCAQKSFTLDAAVHGKAGQWMDTNIELDQLLVLCVNAEGEVDMWSQTPGQHMSGPDGYIDPMNQGPQVVGGHKPGSVIGKIGEAGKEFFIGKNFRETCRDRGTLKLRIVPSAWNNAISGAYTVSVRTEHAGIR